MISPRQQLRQAGTHGARAAHRRRQTTDARRMPNHLPTLPGCCVVQPARHIPLHGSLRTHREGGHVIRMAAARSAKGRVTPKPTIHTLVGRRPMHHALACTSAAADRPATGTAAGHPQPRPCTPPNTRERKPCTARQTQHGASDIPRKTQPTLFWPLSITISGGWRRPRRIAN